MKQFALLIALIFTSLYLEAHTDKSSVSTEKTESKKEATFQIDSSIFSISESTTPKDASRMTRVHFYSKDNESGYLIIQRKKKTIIHKNVPKGIWKALKNAKSTSGYYNFYIKNKYSLAR